MFKILPPLAPTLGCSAIGRSENGQLIRVTITRIALITLKKMSDYHSHRVDNLEDLLQRYVGEGGVAVVWEKHTFFWSTLYVSNSTCI